MRNFTAKEFKEKFRVGQTVENQKGFKVTITAIGEERFLGVSPPRRKEVCTMISNYHWKEWVAQDAPRNAG